MNRNNLYLGLPDKDWDNLCLKAEDLLRDEKLGTHLLGIYPVGNRIFGFEKTSPSIFCLYLDSIDNLLDPCQQLIRPFDHFVLDNDPMANIYMAEINSWIRWCVHTNTPTSYIDKYFRSKLFHIIPGLSTEVIYEDKSIYSIIETVTSFISLYGHHNFVLAPLISSTQSLILERALVILQLTNNFLPCINPDWGKVYNIQSLPVKPSNEIIRLDKRIRKLAIKNELKFLSYEDKQQYLSWLYQKKHIEYLNNKPKLANHIINSVRESISEETIKFFRWQL